MGRVTGVAEHGQGQWNRWFMLITTKEIWILEECSESFPSQTSVAQQLLYGVLAVGTSTISFF